MHSVKQPQGHLQLVNTAFNLKHYLSRLSLLASVFLAILMSQPVNADEDVIAVTVQDPYVEVHTGPGRGYPVFHVIEKGEIVRLQKQFTQWVKVTSQDNSSGWIRQDDVHQLTDAHGRRLTQERQQGKAGQFSLQVAIGTFDGENSSSGTIGYGLSEQLRFDLVLAQNTEGFLQGQTLYGQVNLDFARQKLWQPYLNIGYGVFQSDGQISGSSSFDALKSSLGIRRKIISGLEGTVEYGNSIIFVSGSSNVHAESIKLGILAYF